MARLGPPIADIWNTVGPMALVAMGILIAGCAAAWFGPGRR